MEREKGLEPSTLCLGSRGLTDGVAPLGWLETRALCLESTGCGNAPELAVEVLVPHDRPVVG